MAETTIKAYEKDDGVTLVAKRDGVVLLETATTDVKVDVEKRLDRMAVIVKGNEAALAAKVGKITTGGKTSLSEAEIAKYVESKAMEVKQ